MGALAIAKSYYEAFNNKNWEGMLAHLSDNIKHETNQGEPRMGIEKFREFLQHMDECYDEQLVDMVFFSEPNDTRVAVEFLVKGIYKKQDGDDLPPAKHQNYDLPAAAFLEISEGKIARLTTYYNLPLWIKLVSA